MTSPDGPPAVGCDLELVEPRTPGFVSDFLTAAEQRWWPHARPVTSATCGANLIWSAKESALKVLRTGLRRDTRTVEVTLAAPRADGWGALTVRAVEGTVFPGWWRREGRFLLTVATEVGSRRRSPSATQQSLAAAAPRHSWLDRPLYRDIPRSRASTM